LYLLKSVSKIAGQVEFTLIGSRPSVICKPLDEALARYRWIYSLPHDKILEEMRNHDVLVLPSLFEGFVLVILEAMSQGLPVITTDNSGGSEVVNNGESGFIIPMCSVEPIVEKISLLSQNRDILIYMGMQAQKRASLSGWEKHRRDIINALS